MLKGATVRDSTALEQLGPRRRPPSTINETRPQLEPEIKPDSVPSISTASHRIVSLASCLAAEDQPPEGWLIFTSALGHCLRIYNKKNKDLSMQFFAISVFRVLSALRNPENFRTSNFVWEFGRG